MGFFSEADNNGAELDVNTVLTLSQLMMELQSYELVLNGGKLVQEKPEANFVVGPLSSKGKQKAKGKKKSTKSSIPPRVDRKKATKSKDPKKIKCFFFNRKSSFQIKLQGVFGSPSRKGKIMKLFVVEACLVKKSIDN
ncbi:hypothetical protein PVK06_028608 [Gossypium arboreum]|uniref:Gag/pol protein n=1 Tax=Gossypium arboreum TaxID=29729 RepID=A0ABR0P4I8_GOSAR|nr:hypothetical protein PVK06_028608 [Gossypium arboreum]